MANWFSGIKDWKGWHLIWALLKTLPVFFLKTKTGRTLLLALLSKAGVVISGDALGVILEALFYLIVGNGILNANEPVEIIKQIFEEELKKIKAKKKDGSTKTDNDSTG